MPYVLRKVDIRYWDKDSIYSNPDSWLRPGMIPAACLIDLRATGNELSLFYVEGKNDPNITHICAALAATRNSLSHFGYGLFDVGVIEGAQFALRTSEGDTADESVNVLHRDIRELTAQRLVQFLEAIWDSAEIRQIYKKELKGIIKENIRTGRIDSEKIDEKLLEELNR